MSGIKGAYHFILVIALLLCSIGKAQVNAGKITYERKTNLYKKFKDDDVKEWLKEEDKNKTDVFELYFNDSISAFKPQESDLKERMSWATSKNVVYQNYNGNKRLTMKTIWGEMLWVSDSLYIRTWKITDSKRNIAGYSCRKAIWQANDSTRIYAWYCDEISVSIGPESFVGLPGAILGLATEDGGVIYFAKSVQVQTVSADVLLPQKIKGKIYTGTELRTKLEKDFGKQKWGKAMIREHFGFW
ncbi:MAG TPA: GLPGLI family protein [Bacteroidia bacterium]